MSFKARFLSVAVFNCLLLIGLIFVFSQNSLAFSQRLVDLNLENPTDLHTFTIFAGALVAELLVNVVLLASRKSEFSYDQMRALVNMLGGDSK